MYYVYVLENYCSTRYIGQTNNLNNRLKRHNANMVRSTRYKGPWKIIFSKEFLTRKESILYEKYLKSLKKSEYIKNILISR